MKIATWNVNSLKVRLPHLLNWLAEDPVDVVCLQETKTVDDKFPREALEAAGWHCEFSGQPTYNGVAILTRLSTVGPPARTDRGIPHFEDPQKRVISVEVAGLWVVNVYIPNGQSLESDKYAYKLQWLQALQQWLELEIPQRPPLMLLGDYNIAPSDEDVHDPMLWTGQILCSDPEREAFQKLLQLGLLDAFRLFDQKPRTFTWWDYRDLGFRKNKGLRIDHVLLAEGLRNQIAACEVKKTLRALTQPSDHAPVVVTLNR